MAQVNTMAEGSARLNPCSPQNITHWQAHRLQDAWRYKGPDSAKNYTLAPSQVSYAITLRRQLATSLKDQASHRVAVSQTAESLIWTSISTACRREIQRCERAHIRLAQKAVLA